MTESTKVRASEAQRKVFIVPHTHWDREWYFTTQQSKVLLLETLAVVLQELERGGLPCFVLDGQTALLEDYLELAPQERDRITSLVSAGKLLIGPWYTQTDQCVVGAESIARNLLYGIRDSREFGGHMPIAYVPDSFGQTEQLPQILNQFGLRRCVFWRGWWEGVIAAAEFIWASRDGSRVTTAVIRSGYSGVKGMPGDDEVQERRLRQIHKQVTTLENINATKATLVMAGNDQQPWDPRLPALLDSENQRQDKLRYELSDMGAFFDHLHENATLETVTAEMLAGKYSRIHRGIYSTRYDIKKANADTETLITHVLEPILTIGWSLGMSYPHGLLETVWKKLLKSHAHDSIGCCNTDEVNRAVKQRFIDARQMCTQQLQLRLRQIAERVVARQQGERLLLFNPLPEVRSGPVEVSLVVESENAPGLRIVDGDGNDCVFDPLDCRPVNLSELVQDLEAALKPGQKGDPVLYRHRLLLDAGELPALGYSTLYIQTGKAGEAARGQPSKQSDEISNEMIRVRVSPDGTLTINDRRGGAEYAGLLEFIDGGDDGDNYDFSPPRDDWLISSRGQRPSIEVRAGKLKSTMRLSWQLKVPADLTERGSKKTSVTMPVTATLDLVRGQEYLDIRVDVDNNALEHRLQALFRTRIETTESFAEQPFGMIRRSSQPPELEVWQNPEGGAEWTSRPLPLYPMQSLVALSDGHSGFAVITDGIREYEIDPDRRDELALTLFRSVGFMGKPDLVYRPGRLSGMPTPTPESQLQGPLSFHFAIMPFTGEPAAVQKTARRFLSGIQSYQASDYNRFSINRGSVDLPDNYSLMRHDSPLVISAIKKAEDRDAVILRAFNPSEAEVPAGHLFPLAENGWNTAVIGRSTLNEDSPDSLETRPLPEVVAPQQVITFTIEKSRRFKS